MKKTGWLTATIVLLLGATLAGCSGKEPAGTNAPAEQSQAASPTAEASGGQAETGAEAGTETGAQANVFPYTGPEITLTIGLPFESWKPKDGEWSKPVPAEALKRIGNVKFEYVVLEDPDKLQVMMNTGEFPDILMTYDVTNKTKTYGKSGVLLNFSQYAQTMPNVSAMAEKYPFVRLGQTAEGDFYGIAPNINTQNVFFGWAGWKANQHYIKQLGLTPPTTLDELHAYLKAVKQANPDSKPLLLSYDDHISLFARLFGSGKSFAYDYGNGKWLYQPLDRSDELREAISYVHTLYAEELIPKDFLTLSQDQIRTMYWQGDTWAITPWTYADYETQIANTQQNTPDFAMVPFLPPVVKPGDVHQVSAYEYPGSPPWFGILVNAKTKQPEFVAALLDLLASPDMRELTMWGFEGQTFVRENGQVRYVPEMKTTLNPQGTMELSEWGLYSHWDSKPFILATGGYPEGFAQNWMTAFDVEQMKLYKDYYEAHPELQVNQPRIDTLDLSQAELDLQSRIMTPVQKFVDEELVKFVVGRRSLSEWDSFVAEIPQKGNVTEILDLFNSKDLPRWVK